MKKIIVTLVLVVGIVVALAAFEGMGENRGGDFHGKNHKNMGMNRGMGNSHGMNRGMGDGLGMIMSELDLTDAQKEQIEGLRAKHQKNMIQVKADIDILKVDKQNFMQDQDFGKVKKLTGQIYDRKKERALNQVGQHEAIWNVLTEAQQAKLIELKQDRPHSKMNNHEKMMGGNKMQGMKEHKGMKYSTE